MSGSHELLNCLERKPLDNLVDLDYKSLLNKLKGQQLEEEVDLGPVIKTLSQFISSAAEGKDLVQLAINESKLSGNLWAIKSHKLFGIINNKSVNLEFDELYSSLETILASQSGESVVVPEDGLENAISFIQELADYTNKIIPDPLFGLYDGQMELGFSPSQ